MGGEKEFIAMMNEGIEKMSFDDGVAKAFTNSILSYSSTLLDK